MGTALRQRYFCLRKNLRQTRRLGRAQRNPTISNKLQRTLNIHAPNSPHYIFGKRRSDKRSAIRHKKTEYRKHK